LEVLQIRDTLFRVLAHEHPARQFLHFDRFTKEHEALTGGRDEQAQAVATPRNSEKAVITFKQLLGDIRVANGIEEET
jgi:hypothetical protein